MANVALAGRRRFVVVLAALLTLGFLATTLVSYFVARDSLQRQVSEQMLPLTSDNIYSEIQRDLLRPILISSLMASDTFVRDWALDGEQDSERIISYLREIQQQYGTITAFFVSDHTLNYYHPDGILKVLDPADPADGWYFPLRGLAAPYAINVDLDTADRSRLSIFINYRVLDYLGRFIGATGVGLSVYSVVRLIDSYQGRYGRLIYFVNREGEVTLHGDGFDLPMSLRERPGLAPFATQILANPSTSVTYRNHGGHDIHLNSRLVPEFDWYLVVEQHSGQGREGIKRSLLVNILISLVITAAVLLLAHFTLRRYQQRLIDMATIDKLTGAFNRQAFESLFAQAAARARRRGTPMTLLAIDLDFFKAVNDNFGHQGGDSLIQGVATLLAELTRESDTLCRWGGEEFMLLFEDCTLSSALGRAEEIRRRIKGLRVRYGREDLAVTISIGVSEYHGGESLEALASRADGALYQAKREGRDRVKSA